MTAIEGATARRTLLAGPACRIASSPAELETHFRIRQAVFVHEQRLFESSDLDEHDTGDSVVHVIGLWDGEPVGVVRLFPLDDGNHVWQGDRLAVLPSHRARNLGRPLVRFAVATATALGGETMQAHVQLPNVTFFQRLGWQRSGDIETYVGAPHQPMSFDLLAQRS